MSDSIRFSRCRCVKSGRALLVAVVVLVGASAPLLLLRAGRAWAHSNGQVQLYVADIQIAKVQGGLAVSVDLVDQDSGAPAPGFGVRLTASADAGTTIGPLELADVTTSAHSGRYQAVVAFTPGLWQITATAELGQSALPAIPGATKVATVRVSADGSVAKAGSGSSSSAGLVIGLIVGGVVLAAGLVAWQRRRGGSRSPRSMPPDR